MEESLLYYSFIVTEKNRGKIVHSLNDVHDMLNKGETTCQKVLWLRGD